MAENNGASSNGAAKVTPRLKTRYFEEIRPTIRDSQMLAPSSRRPTAIVLNKQALR